MIQKFLSYFFVVPDLIFFSKCYLFSASIITSICVCKLHILNWTLERMFMKMPLPPFSIVATHLEKEPDCSSLELKGRQSVALKRNCWFPLLGWLGRPFHQRLLKKVEFLKTHLLSLSSLVGQIFRLMFAKWTGY